MDTIRKDEKRFKLQFGTWAQCLSTAKVNKVEELIKKVHAEIRKNPDRPVRKARQQQKTTYSDKERTIVTNAKKPYKRDRRLTNEQRKRRVNDKIKKYAAERSKAR